MTETKYSAAAIEERGYSTTVIEAFLAFSPDLLDFIWDNPSPYYQDILKGTYTVVDLINTIAAILLTTPEDETPGGNVYESAIVILTMIEKMTDEELKRRVAEVAAQT